METVEISWWAVIVAAVAKFVIGWIWYAPPVLGNNWMAEVKLSQDEFRANMVPAIITQIVGDLVMAYILARFIAHYGTPSIGSGLLIGFMAWLGFVATVTIGQVVYERRSFKLFLINSGYILIGLLVMGAILGWWHEGVAAVPPATAAPA